MKKRRAPDLDSLLTLAEASKWLGLSPTRLRRKTKGGAHAQIPSCKVGGRIKFHPRIVLAKLATDAGVKREVIQDAFTKIFQ